MSSGQVAADLTKSPHVALGRTEPRFWTPPLRDLSDPESSWGYDFIDFCELIGWPLDPWQRWLAIHLGELFPDGSPRFRKAIIVIARQNGKSLFATLLVLYWMFVERVPLVFGTHKDRGEAKKAWNEAIAIAESSPLLADRLLAVHIVRQIGEEDFWNDCGAHYQFSAPNRRAARGKTVHRALIDELREHKTRDCWDALVPATVTIPDALVVCLSNEGPLESEVLHEEYDAALEYAETGVGDDTTFLAAWSAPAGADPEDLEALAMANPNLGHRIPVRALLGEARKNKRLGGNALARFRTEHMCQRVTTENPAIDGMKWDACRTAEPLDLAGNRNLALSFDVARDNSHATACVAAVVDGITHLEVAGQWWGEDCRAQMREELPELARRIKPRVVACAPNGPAAAVMAELGRRKGPRALYGRVEEIVAGDMPRVCMGLEEIVVAGQMCHPGEPLLDQHIGRTQRLEQGKEGLWVFTRAGSEPVDASYAAALAVHAARLVPQLKPLPD